MLFMKKTLFMIRTSLNCNKKQYASEDDVIFVGREQMFNYNSEQLYYYFCDTCESWHLTSKPTDKKII